MTVNTLHYFHQNRLVIATLEKGAFKKLPFITSLKIFLLLEVLKIFVKTTSK